MNAVLIFSSYSVITIVTQLWKVLFLKYEYLKFDNRYKDEMPWSIKESAPLFPWLFDPSGLSILRRKIVIADLNQLPTAITSSNQCIFMCHMVLSMSMGYQCFLNALNWAEEKFWVKMFAHLHTGSTNILPDIETVAVEEYQLTYSLTWYSLFHQKTDHSSHCL